MRNAPHRSSRGLTALLGGFALLSAQLSTPPAQAQESPPSYRQGVLAYSKCLLAQGNPAIDKAFEALIQRADEALVQPLYSVVDKTHLPASGNPHDYFSFAPYWWPNPETDDGLPYVRRDGEYNMATRTEATDKQRMIDFAKDVSALGLAYYFTDDPAYARKAAEQLVNWFVDPATRMAPNMAYAQAIPGRVDGRDIGIIDSRLLIDVADSVELLRASKALSPADYRAIKAWYADFLDWLLTSDNGREEEQASNNHGTWYDAQVVAFALFTDQPAVARKQLRLTRQRIDEQFGEDGQQPEELQRTRPWHYVNFNLEAYARLALYAEKLDMEIWEKGKEASGLERGFEFVARHALQDQPWPYEELEGFKASTALSNVLAAALAYDDPLFARVVARLADKDADARALLLYSPFQATSRIDACVLPPRD